LKDKLELLYQFLSGAMYASTGASSQVLGSACERLDEIIKELDDNETLKSDDLMAGVL
jgi:hypothetical protein